MKKYNIFQLHSSHDAKFMGLDFVKEYNVSLSLSDYEKVFDGVLEENEKTNIYDILDDIFRRFNIGKRPEGFTGHSLSVSDVIELDGKFYYCDSMGWEEISFQTAPKNKFNNKKSATMKKSEKKVTMTTDEKVFNLCVESAKQSKNGYTFNLKDVWQAARKKYKMAKQDVIDAFTIITKEHEIKKVNEGPSDLFALVELMPKQEQTAKQTPKKEVSKKQTAEQKQDSLEKLWRDMKAKNPEAIYLIRRGDFYETYEGDAEVCATVLGITLTKNNKTGRKLAGFPQHALDTYLPKLIRAGKKVAICDSLETPKQAAKETAPKRKAAAESGKVKEQKQPKHVLTECEVINLKAQKKARELYPDTFTRFTFSRFDSTAKKEYKNADAALKGKADMNNLLYVIKVVEGVEYTGKTRIGAYESFLAATAV